MAKEPKPGYYATRPEKINELALLQLTKNLDAEVARQAKNRLIIDNEGFLRNFVAKKGLKGLAIDFEYLLEEARLAFLTAIEHYDLKKDVSIRTYARYYLLGMFKKMSREKKYTELDEEGHSELTFILNPDFRSLNLRELLFQALEKTLTVTEIDVVCLYFFEGLKKRKIARLRKCSEVRIGNIVKKALPKLKVYLTSIGVTPGFLELN